VAPPALPPADRRAAYDFGPGHPFQSGRLEAGLSLLRAAKVLGDGDLLAFGPADDADLELIHDRDYLAAATPVAFGRADDAARELIHDRDSLAALARLAGPGAAAADPAGAAGFGL